MSSALHASNSDCSVDTGHGHKQSFLKGEGHAKINIFFA